jgi:hypothetical protein
MKLQSPVQVLESWSLSTDHLTSLPMRPLTLGEYIAALIALLGETSPAALARLKLIVGDRRARISLDDESVEVVFDQNDLLVLPITENSKLSGQGATDTETVLDLLSGEVEVASAILSGRLRITAAADDIERIFSAIEILLDASPRAPVLQELAARFQKEKLQHAQRSRAAASWRVQWYPFSLDREEMDLLARLDLLP